MAACGFRWRSLTEGIRRVRSRGFTLLEVLVGVVIAALAFGALSVVGLTGLGITRTTERYQQATALARSHLAMAMHADPLLAGD